MTIAALERAHLALLRAQLHQEYQARRGKLNNATTSTTKQESTSAAGTAMPLILQGLEDLTYLGASGPYPSCS